MCGVLAAGACVQSAVAVAGVGAVRHSRFYSRLETMANDDVLWRDGLLCKYVYVLYDIMEMDILQLVGIVIGSNSVVGFIVALITIKYQKSKVQGEAHSAQYEGMKVEQDTYQELILDLKSAWKEQKEYIAELHEDRRNLRVERDDFKRQIDELVKKLNEQQGEIEELKRMTRSFKPLICSQVGCMKRQSDIIGLISDDSFDVNNKGA